MAKHKYLTKEQIQEAKQLKEQGLSKRKLAEVFEVGSTTIWENIFCDNYKRPKRITVTTTTISYRNKDNISKCPICEKLLTKEVNSKTIPLNLQIMDRCITCYLRSIGLEYMDLI